MVAIRQQLVTGGNRRVNAGTNPVSSITIHETGNPGRGANAAAHGNLQSRAGMGAISWHYTVDDREIVQSYEDTARCRHAGTDAGNNTSLSIEICVNSDGNFDKAVDRAAQLTAAKMKQHGVPLSAVRQHNSWWGKDCPQRLRANGNAGWNRFTALVRQHLGENVVISPPPPPSSGGKTIAQMVAEVRAGKHGNGHTARQQSLGVTDAVYAQVRAGVNAAEGVSAPAPAPAGRSIAQMAAEVKAGKHGNGHAARRASLGVSQAVYEQVRAEVNRLSGVRGVPSTGRSISQMANEVIAGAHGNGHANRQRSLGVDNATYAAVRAEVNRRA